MRELTVAGCTAPAQAAQTGSSLEIKAALVNDTS